LIDYVDYVDQADSFSQFTPTLLESYTIGTMLVYLGGEIDDKNHIE